MANKAFKFRLYPSVLQEQLIIKTFGCCRFIYNKMLADRKSHYEQFHEALKNTPAQYKGEYQFLKEVEEGPNAIGYKNNGPAMTPKPGKFFD